MVLSTDNVSQAKPDPKLCKDGNGIQQIKKIVSDTTGKIKELVRGETENYVSPIKYCDIEETHVRKLTGVRYSGGVKEPSLSEIRHEKESQFLRGIVPGSAPYPLSRPGPSSDRPYVPDVPELDDPDDDYGWEKENIAQEMECLRCSLTKR